MDETVAACTDFFQYANGNWLKTTQIPAAQPAWGSFNILAESNRTVVLQDDLIIGFANDFLAPATSWILLLACVGVYAVTQIAARMSRRKAGLPNPITVCR